MRKSAILTTTLTVSAISAATLVCGASANAYPREETIGLHCYGQNPNILLFPFYGGARVTLNTPVRGQISISSDSKDPIPYTTDTTVRVTDLRTNRTQTYHRRWQHSLSDIGGYRIDGIAARGRTRVSVSAVNHGLFQTLRGPTCTGIVSA
ncbi:hypothetical protein [Gordonia sp. CPCC 205333]|uniref:hypothetical protein n=1 Tax=Gordonia sp. CPCC 205333 TaxID=3140790 RepID=UPI003AF388CB